MAAVVVAAARACGGGLDVERAMDLPLTFLTWLMAGAAELEAAVRPAAAALPLPAAATAVPTRPGDRSTRSIALGGADETPEAAMAKLRWFLSQKIGG